VIILLAAALFAGTPSADLRIEVRASRTAPVQVRTLRCNPPGGTLARRAEACARLGRLRDPFAPVPKDVVCTQVYGGPEVARVRGTFRGRRVDASFNRRNGCEIRRWDRVHFVFAPSP
jgi:hypothetical protein